MFVPKVRVQGAKVRTSINTSRSGMQQKQAAPAMTPSTTQDQHGRCWSAQCSNHCNLGASSFPSKSAALMQVAMIAALCTPAVPVLILSWSVAVVIGVACCCCIPLQLVLMLVLSFAPCTLTFGTNTPLAHVVVSPIATCAGGM